MPASAFLARIRATTVVVALLAPLAGCGGSRDQTSLVLYNGQHLELTNELVREFENKTGIDVRLRTADSIVLADQILQEGDASPADVYISENAPEITRLEQEGLLATLGANTLNQVPHVN